MAAIHPTSISLIPPGFLTNTPEDILKNIFGRFETLETFQAVFLTCRRWRKIAFQTLRIHEIQALRQFDSSDLPVDKWTKEVEAAADLPQLRSCLLAAEKHLLTTYNTLDVAAWLKLSAPLLPCHFKIFRVTLPIFRQAHEQRTGPSSPECRYPQIALYSATMELCKLKLEDQALVLARENQITTDSLYQFIGISYGIKRLAEAKEVANMLRARGDLCVRLARELLDQGRLEEAYALFDELRVPCNDAVFDYYLSKGDQINAQAALKRLPEGEIKTQALIAMACSNSFKPKVPEKWALAAVCRRLHEIEQGEWRGLFFHGLITYEPNAQLTFDPKVFNPFTDWGIMAKQAQLLFSNQFGAYFIDALWTIADTFTETEKSSSFLEIVKLAIAGGATAKAKELAQKIPDPLLRRQALTLFSTCVLV